MELQILVSTADLKPRIAPSPSAPIMTTLKHFRCLGQFPESVAILDEILSQPELFDVDASRQERIKVQRETRSIPVRIKERRADLPEQKDRDVLGSRWTPWAGKLPTLQAFLERVAEQQQCLIGRVRVVNLPAGQRVYPHVDRGNYYQQHERHHLVLKSSQGSWLKSGSEDIRMQEGELWWFDNRALHEAHNDGTEDRIHVIFDLLPRTRAHLLDAPVAVPKAHASGRALPAGIHHLQWPGCLPVQVIVPEQVTDSVPLVTVHGMMRDVQAQVQALAPKAQAAGRFVIAPLFDERHFPKYRLARCPRQADAALLRTLRAVADGLGLSMERFDLAGFSAGAQFSHRFAMLYPNRVRRLIISSAGWYTWPDAVREHPYPAGLAGTDLAARIMHANLSSYLSLPITIAVGQQDCVSDPTTRRDALIDRVQGTQRAERARQYAAALERAARQLGVRSTVDLHVLPGAGHDFTSCALAGLLDLMLPRAATDVNSRHSSEASVRDAQTLRLVRETASLAA